MSESKRPVYVVGHRGAAKVLPENTLKGFRYALDLGVDMIECDVHLTRDEHLVVIHDDTVDRTSNGSGEVRRMSLTQIQELDAGDGERIPTFEEVLEVVGGQVTLLCELKGAGTEEAAVEAVRNRGLVEHVIFTSFHIDRLERVRDIGEDYRIGPILPDPTPVQLAAAVELGATGVGVHYPNLSLRIVEEVHSAGLDLRAWNPDTLPEMKAMIALGADGIGTNRPDILIEYLHAN